jgi:hypothetical protein
LAFVLLEQSSYSGGRFLFWVLTPVLVTDAWDKIATLSLVSLLTMTLYSSIIGGPAFFRLVNREADDIRDSYLLCQTIIAGLALIGPSLYTLVWWPVTVEDSGFVGLMFLLPWVSSAADWARRTQLLLKEPLNLLVRNFLFIIIWLSYSIFLFLGVFDALFFHITLMFCFLSAVIYLPIHGVLRGSITSGLIALAPFSVWRSYLTVGLLAYVFGNTLFWLNDESRDLVDFVIFRNYLNPVLLLSLYIESYGAIQLAATENKWPVILRYVIGVAFVTAMLTCFAVFLINYGAPDANTFDATVLLLVAICTFLIALIKLPTVYLRLKQRDNLVSRAYLIMIPIWPLVYGFDILRHMPYSGIEILVMLYLILFLSLSAFAISSKADAHRT